MSVQFNSIRYTSGGRKINELSKQTFDLESFDCSLKYDEIKFSVQEYKGGLVGDAFEVIIWGVPMWCLYLLLTGDAFKKDAGYTSSRFVIGVVSVGLCLAYIKG